MGFAIFSGLLFLTLCIFLKTAATGNKYGEIKCGVMFKPTDEFLEIMKNCAVNKEGGKGNKTKRGGGMGKDGLKKFLSEDAKLEDFIDWDDGCLRECTYQQLGVINENGLLDKQQTEVLFKDSNPSAKMVEKVVEFWNSCIDEADKLTQAKGLSDSCKTMMLHDICFMRKIRGVKLDC